MTDTGALPDDCDARLLAALSAAFGDRPPARLGIAVSGGGDSMALLHLACRLPGVTVEAATVDHRLRPEAAGEARQVAAACQRLGVPHRTLVWDRAGVAGNLQDQARRARQRLLAGWARDRGLGDVALGHTADDRAETFLMELAREAGLDGLSAMRPTWVTPGIRWWRPLLSVTRAGLRDYLTRQGLSWAEDPTNADSRFQRVRARRALAALAPLGITAGGLARVAGHLAAARAELEALAARSAAGIARESAGEVLFDRAGWLALGPDTGRRLLTAALRRVTSAPYAPRAAELGRLAAAIRQGRDATLGGCHLRVTETSIRFTREPRAVAGVETPTDALWDGRWRLSGPHHPELSVRALGAEGLRLCRDWRDTGQSRAALVVTPAIWRGTALVAAPLAGKPEGWRAEIASDLPSLLFSH